MTPTKAEELRLADAIDPHDSESKVILTIDCAHAATMLRRLSAERDALQRKVQEMALQALADDTQHREVEAERDALLDALNDAAQSLTTIAENAGRSLNTDGTENYLFHFDQVRGYARSRAGVAIDAARATGEHHE